MKTANSVMHELWVNAETISNNMIKINVDHLYELLLELEKAQYKAGYSQGSRLALQLRDQQLPIDNNFENINNSWINKFKPNKI